MEVLEVESSKEYTACEYGKKTNKKSKAQLMRELRKRRKESQDHNSNCEEAAHAPPEEKKLNRQLLNKQIKVIAPKSASQRSREYRERNKLKAQKFQETKTIIPKTSAERSREYRERKKLKAQEVQKTENIRTKTTAERMSEYRERNKFKAQNVPETQTIKAKTAAERMYEYRKRKKDSICVNAQSSFLFKYKEAFSEFARRFTDNKFGVPCSVCDRLWFEKDLRKAPIISHEILKDAYNLEDVTSFRVCVTCATSLQGNKIPHLSISNGFCYKPMPGLPELDLITERLVSPRLPFMQIRRLRHASGQYGIYGQVINMPVNVDNMVSKLPRDLDDDFAINVHIKRQTFHKSSYLAGCVRKNVVKRWLQFLVNKPLYRYYGIEVDESLLSQVTEPVEPLENMSEELSPQETLTAYQQTVMFNEDNYLCLAPAARSDPLSLMFDEHAEELSFPGIYLGEFRKFRDGLRVTPYMMASSELRRTDRRGATPRHVLYMAMKIMRYRVRDSLTIAFKFVGKNTNITRQEIESEEYINSRLETNLAFLKSIPNSVFYWHNRKRDLFAMMRQLGKPTMFLTLSANEVGWPELLSLLYRLRNKKEIEINPLEVHYALKYELVNDDPAVCAMYFNKLVDVIMCILKSTKISPFGSNYVVDYFKRIEFQHRGSPHAHILLWLNNAPRNVLHDKVEYDKSITLIDNLCSVSEVDCIRSQIHNHTFTCYKNETDPAKRKCRFDAPFLPSPQTVILVPMPKSDGRRVYLRKKYNELRFNLENSDYECFDIFLRENNVLSETDYFNILRAGIKRPRVFLKRTPMQKWVNSYNPFVLKVLNSNTDIQFIVEEYSCACYVVEYVNKANRGISNLQQTISELAKEHPEFDIVDITRKLGVKLLNSTEMTAQEAAWYLLRQPMSEASREICYIPSVWPCERTRIRKTKEQLDNDDVGYASCDIWKETIIEKYEKRRPELDNLTLAQFASRTRNGKPRQSPCVIRFRNYDAERELDEYMREMVLLHVPFKSEDLDILSDFKYRELYKENENIIVERRKEFESDLDIAKTLELCKELCDTEITKAKEKLDRFKQGLGKEDEEYLRELYANPKLDSDLVSATFSRLTAVFKSRENVLPASEYCKLMRKANPRQRELILHVINSLLFDQENSVQVFLTGPAGCGKTFTVKLLMETYNRFTETDAVCNSYITCASTGKAAVAIGGTTVHAAFKLCIANSTQRPLDNESAQQYRSLFRLVKVIIIDEISMISAETLQVIDNRLKQITGEMEKPFGGMHIIFVGDLRQLPPVRATPIFKPCKKDVSGARLWKSLKFYELREVMRQSDATFSSLLTKIGSGEELTIEEKALLESRFVSPEEANELCPHGVRLFFRNNAVNMYNNSMLENESSEVSVAEDIYVGCHSSEHETAVRQKVHSMSASETGGLPYSLRLMIEKPYIITTNIDISDGLANGAIGSLIHVEKDEQGKYKRLWLLFDETRIGAKIRSKCTLYIKKHNIPLNAVPLNLRSATVNMNKNRSTSVKRKHFPLLPACAMTIHKSQGATFDSVVYDYEKHHEQSLVYVALSRVRSLQGLFLTSPTNNYKFYHGASVQSTYINDLREETRRLSNNPLHTIQSYVLDNVGDSKFTITSLNVQSLAAHNEDLTDPVLQRSDLLMLSETWMSDEEPVIPVPNFNCVVRYRRDNKRSAGVAIYNNEKSTVVVTPHLTLIQNLKSNTTSAAVTKVGDLCACECVLPDNKQILLVAAYISPNTPIVDIIKFIHFYLLPYSPGGAKLLDEPYDKMPMILSGDFNINFNAPEAIEFVHFLREKFNLHLNTNTMLPTTKSGSTIDAVFQRNLEDLSSQNYVNYFSYHRPIVSSLSEIEH